MAAAAVGNYNKWKIITIKPTGKKYKAEEFEDLKADMLAEIEAELAREIQPGQFGAVETEGDEYHVIQFTSECYSAATDLHNVVEDTPLVPTGTLLVKGVYWNPLPLCARGYTPEPELSAQERVFRVRYLLSADLQMEDFTEADINGLTTYSRGMKDAIKAM